MSLEKNSLRDYFQFEVKHKSKNFTNTQYSLGFLAKARHEQIH